MKLFLLLSCWLTFSFATELESQAKLLASKTVENKYIVENRELTVKYNIYNVGTSVANHVTLMEDSFPVADFEVARGHLSVEWKSIPPNGNVTHVVVLKPHKSGNFNFTSAQLSYLQSDGEDVQRGFTSFPGEGFVMTEIDFARKHSPHLLEWAIFALMCMPSLIIPFGLWYRIQLKYNTVKNKKH